jgi:uncharacterized membrane protein
MASLQERKAAVAKAVEHAVKTEIVNPVAPLDAQSGRVEEAASGVVQKVLAAPAVQVATNTETHVWQKRSWWSAVVSGIFVVAAPLLAKYGFSVTPETQEMVVTLCTTLGGLVAGYLAYRAGTATRPLGA